MAILHPPKNLEIEVADIPEQMLELHERLEQFNFDLVYLPKRVLFEDPEKRREKTIDLFGLEVRTRLYEEYAHVSSSINTLDGNWILFENSVPPQLRGRTGKIKEYENDPFIEIFQNQEHRVFNYKYHRNKCVDYCRNGFEIQKIVGRILPSIAKGLDLNEDMVRLPTAAEYILCQEFYFPFLKKTDISEWTSTMIQTRHPHKLYLINKSQWRNRYDTESAFSYCVDGITGSDGACPSLGFRVVIDPSIKHKMEYTRGWK